MAVSRPPITLPHPTVAMLQVDDEVEFCTSRSPTPHVGKVVLGDYARRHIYRDGVPFPATKLILLRVWRADVLVASVVRSRFQTASKPSGDLRVFHAPTPSPKPSRYPLPTPDVLRHGDAVEYTYPRRKDIIDRGTYITDPFPGVDRHRRVDAQIRINFVVILRAWRDGVLVAEVPRG